MKTQDEKLQESIEQGRFDSSHLDSCAYQIVFDAIQKEPDTHLSPQFSDKILSHIIKAEEKRAFQKDLMWLAVGVLVLVITATVTIVLTGFRLDPGAFKFVSNYGGLLVFAFALIGFFLWIEKKVFPHNSTI
ncbi:MAG: hypothetical protein RIF39_11745 [Cyclobacteriaceae bacterium]